jgi:hypothetical protein
MAENQGSIPVVFETREFRKATSFVKIQICPTMKMQKASMRLITTPNTSRVSAGDSLVSGVPPGLIIEFPERSAIVHPVDSWGSKPQHYSSI